MRFFYSFNYVFLKDKLNKMKKILMLFATMVFVFSANAQKPTNAILKTQAPDSFKIKFITTKGTIVAIAKRSWSPLGVDRLYQLVTTHFYDSIAIFRVQGNYVAQFGISSDASLNTFWEEYPLDDEPVVTGNMEGTISFARGGPKSRTTQLFINLKNNGKLDTIVAGGVKGYPVVARVIDGVDVIYKFYGDYGFEPATMQDSIYSQGNAFIRRRYPNVDYIIRTELGK